MTESSLALDQGLTRYPLSFTQEWFLTFDKGDDGGTFGPRFMIIGALRVSGRVDLATLQGALDDVVARHELLRTVMVRDADPPYQVVLAPCQVPLEVQDLPPTPDESRDLTVQELFMQAEAGSISSRQIPLIKARLCRFDDRDSVLLLTVHHSVSDGWSLHIIVRDLAACYAARRAGTDAVLPPVRQYREYAAWQRAGATSTAADGRPAYWQHKLDGAREFNIPNDREHPDSYSRPYSMHVHSIEPEIMTAAAALATAARTTVFTVLLSAFYLLAHTLTGATDLSIRSFTAGRDEPRFQDTMGLFINLVPFRTDIAACASFREIVTATRETFVDAIANELPVNILEHAFPDFITPRQDRRTSQFIIASQQGQLGEDLTFPIADSARWASNGPLEATEAHDIPSGMVWNLSSRPTGELSGDILYNLDEFDQETVAGLAARLRQILASAVQAPDEDWRQLTAPLRRNQAPEQLPR